MGLEVKTALICQHVEGSGDPSTLTVAYPLCMAATCLPHSLFNTNRFVCAVFITDYFLVKVAIKFLAILCVLLSGNQLNRRVHYIWLDN